MFIDLHSYSKTKLRFFNNHAQGTALLVFLVAILFGLSACSLPSANEAPAGLQVQVRVPAIASQTENAVQGSEVSSLDLVGVDFGLIMVDDRDLSSGTALGTRFSEDIGSLDATESESSIGAQYLTSTLSWQPGRNASVQFDNLNPGARYAIVLYAELEIEDPPGVFSTEERYGYTRVRTQAGETTAALVNLDSNYENLSDQILNWYGIALPVKDTASVSVTPLTVSATEGGADGSYDVVLTTQPTADVNIALASGGEATPTPTALTFTTGNWDTPQTVTVTAVDDAVAEGPHNEIITHTGTSGDAAYNGIAIADVSVDITDNDTPGVSITTLNVSATEGGASGSYDVVLTTPPTADVTLTLVATGGESTPTPTPLTFTTGTWNTAQAVTVAAVDDAVAEGAHIDTITHAATSADGDYNGIVISDVSVDITDNDDFTVSFNDNQVELGDTNATLFGSAPADIAAASGSTVTLPGNGAGPFIRGYAFDGWNTAADGTGTTYAAGASFPDSGDTTLYAQWIGGPGNYAAAFSGGDGSNGNPYQVSSAAELYNLGYRDFSDLALDLYFKQTVDIDLGVAPWNEGDGWPGIGKNLAEFNDEFDGDGKKITNMTIDGNASYSGLFGRVMGATISNVALENVDVTVADGWSGTLLGGGAGFTNQIIDSYATGTLFITTNDPNVGGLVGWGKDVQVLRSFADVTVTASNSTSVGGLVGITNTNTIIEDSYALGDVTGNDTVGGLVGSLEGGSARIDRSYSTGAVSGTTTVGGLVGAYLGGSITDSYYDENASGQNDTGQGIPTSQADMQKQATFQPGTGDWDFTNIWSINENASYPYHQWYTGPVPTP